MCPPNPFKRLAGGAVAEGRAHHYRHPLTEFIPKPLLLGQLPVGVGGYLEAEWCPGLTAAACPVSSTRVIGVGPGTVLQQSCLFTAAMSGQLFVGFQCNL